MIPWRAPSLRVVLVALLLPLVALAAVADDEAEPARETWKIDLSAFRPAPAVLAPSLFLPTDYGRVSAPSLMREGRVDPAISFVTDTGGYAPSVEMLLDFLISTELGVLTDEGELELSVYQERELVFRGTAAAIRRAKAVTAWMLQAVLPTVEARATLLVDGEDGALLATGAARLSPGRWVGLYRDRNTTPLAVDWEIEIAQESTAVYPTIVQMPEGQELYLRYHPGEAVSLVEVWSGALTHLDVREVDLSGIRNVPEASGLGVLQLPQTAGYRTYTAIVIPTDAPSRRELRWNGEAGPMRLALEFGPPTASPAGRQGGNAYTQAFRIGAIAAPLEFDQRPDLSDHLVELATQEFEGEETVAALTRGLLLYSGTEAGARRLAASLAAEEKRLRGETIGVRVLRVEEAAVRREISEGRLGIGRPLLDSQLAELAKDGGSVAGRSLILDVLAGHQAGVRVGRSVTGLYELSVEVAQQAGGTDPVVASMFDGLAGNLILLPRPDGTLDLDVHLRLDHASPETGLTHLVHRAPVTMRGGLEALPLRDGASESVPLALLGGGSSVIAGTIQLPKRGLEVLCGVVVRGGEAYLVLIGPR